ncbi:hypothetical protein EHYA_07413 [Embleya hyalina]|uniref:Uncharacterized protein n=1 Tax=Embleya hyalina TaxID=516124 RepID=A0A401YYM1_9ACTN|nr:hypothetical protein [Embleya hyalina]GCD99691.1 hypothetical protein EHYA_07413 [Embleya hyalina]
MRRITQPLPPDRARELFEAHHAGTSERDLERIVAAGPHQAYFQESGTRAEDLDVVELTDVDYIDFDIQG